MDDDDKLSFLERFLGKYKYSSNTKETEFFCCFCTHHKPKLSVNLDTDYWQCWVCGKAGKNLVYLLRSAGGTKSDVKEYIRKYKSKSSSFREIKYENVDFRPDLPPEFTPIVAILDTFLGKKAFNYLTKVRKISPQDILRYKIGLTNTDEWQNSIIFPSFDKSGHLNYFTSRYYDGRKRSVTAPRGYKNQIILNELNIDWDKPIVITEGPVDMLKSVSNTVPLFGSTVMVHSKLFETVVTRGTDVILALDVDAKKKANFIAESFMHYGVSVYTMDMYPYKDLGEMTKEEVLIRYENATLLTGESVFRNKLRMLC